MNDVKSYECLHCGRFRRADQRHDQSREIQGVVEAEAAEENLTKYSSPGPFTEAERPIEIRKITCFSFDFLKKNAILVTLSKPRITKEQCKYKKMFGEKN